MLSGLRINEGDISFYVSAGPKLGKAFLERIDYMNDSLKQIYTYRWLYRIPVFIHANAGASYQISNSFSIAFDADKNFPGIPFLGGKVVPGFPRRIKYVVNYFSIKLGIVYTL